MTTIIRSYQPEDAAAILEIINYNILNSTSLYEYNPRTLAEQIKIIDDKISKKFPVIVLEINNTVVGFGMYSEFRFRQAYQFTVEHSVYVHNDYQYKGIGKKILEKLIELAREQKLHTMIAVIDSENQNSVSFHEQFGFQKVGYIKECAFKFNRWLDLVLMQKII